MSNKYLEKIASKISDEEANSAAWSNVRHKLLGRVVGAPFLGVGAPVGAHLFGKSQLDELYQKHGKKTLSHGEVAGNQLTATLNGMGRGFAQSIAGGAAGGLVGHLIGGQKAAMPAAMVGGLVGGVHGTLMGEKNQTARFIKRNING